MALYVKNNKTPTPVNGFTISVEGIVFHSHNLKIKISPEFPFLHIPLPLFENYLSCVLKSLPSHSHYLILPAFPLEELPLPLPVGLDGLPVRQPLTPSPPPEPPAIVWTTIKYLPHARLNICVIILIISA